MWSLPTTICYDVVLLLYPAVRPFDRKYALISFVRAWPSPASADLQIMCLLTHASCDLTFTGPQGVFRENTISDFLQIVRSSGIPDAADCVCQ
jgi:hypothetical protein